MTPACHDLHEHLVDLSAGKLDDARAASLRSHAATCRPCDGLVRSQAVLERELRSLPGAPIGPLEAPELPARAPPMAPARLLRWAAAAAAVAAMALVAVSVGQGLGPHDEAATSVNPERRVAGARPHISKIVEMSGSGVASDDGLLALTAGLEAVAMRRPAKGR